MMIQNTTFLRRAVGSLLVALVALVGFQTQAQTFDFTVTEEIEWNEAIGIPSSGVTTPDALSELNSRIATALGDDDYAAVCFVMSGIDALGFAGANADPATDLNCMSRAGLTTNNGRLGTSGDLDGDLVVRTGQHVDYEKGPMQVLTITGYNNATKAEVGKLTVNITITNFDEQPRTAQTMPKVIFMDPGKSESFLISRYFDDPEGTPVKFNPANDSNDVWICDQDDPGEFEMTVEPPTPGDADTPTSVVTFGGADAPSCSVSNATSVRGDAGHRVVSTRKVGPVLQITADSLVYDDDSGANDAEGNPTPPIDRQRGTYLAHVYFRVWSNDKSSSNWVAAHIFVKVGANNAPQFAGGATGFTATLAEGTDTTDAETAWVAGDLDELARGGSNTADTLVYNLRDEDDGKVKAPGGGTIELVRTPATGTPVTALALKGTGLDFEGGSWPFRVYLEVTDNWSDEKAFVPIDITVTDENELLFRKEGDGETDKKIKSPQRILVTSEETFDLNDYFWDPEEDELEFEAYSNITTTLATEEDGILTLKGGNTNANKATHTETVTVTATDGKTIREMVFEVNERYKNDAPSINLVEEGTISIGTSVFEADSPGYVVAYVEYKDDDDDVPTASVDSDLFDTKVNACVKDNAICTGETPNMVAVFVKAAGLNHEPRSESHHTINLSMQDSWDPELETENPLEIQVSVLNSEENPHVVEGAEIGPQMIVVNGSDEMAVGDYFDDEDGDRLIISGKSSDPTKVRVTEDGLDIVRYEGLAVGEVTVSLQAEDSTGRKSEALTFMVVVGETTILF